MDLLFCLARICWQQGDEDRALELVKRALTADDGGMLPLEAADDWHVRVVSLFAQFGNESGDSICFLKLEPPLARFTFGSDSVHLN